MVHALCILGTVFYAGAALASGDKNPLDYPIRTWMFVLLMALLGGLASWVGKVRKGEVAAHNLFALIGEFVVAALAGLIAFLLCDYLDAPLGITGALSGLAGHAGAQALALFEAAVQRGVLERWGVGTSVGDADKHGE